MSTEVIKGSIRWLSVGVDPGLTGGVALIGVRGEQEIIKVYPMPVKKTARGKTVDSSFLYATLLPLWDKDSGPPIIAVESVHSMPGQGVTSMFTFGMGYGKVLAAIEILGWPMLSPTPQMWQKLVLKGRTGGKDASIAYALSRYPGVSLKPTARSKNDSHGLADALCLAEYAYRQRLRKIEEGSHVKDA